MYKFFGDWLKKNSKLILNAKGLGLPEITLAGALLGGLVLVSMQISKLGNQSVQRINREQSILNLNQEILGTLNDPRACKHTILSVGSNIGLASITGSSYVEISSIKNKENQLAYTADANSGSQKDFVRLKRLYITNYNSGTKMAQLKLEYSYTGANNTVTKTKSSNLSIVSDATETNVAACMLKTVASSYSDSTPPTVTINRASTQPDLTATLPIVYDVVFSEMIDIASFTTDDITQTGSATVSEWTIVNSGDNKKFTLSATAVSVSGTIAPILNAGKVHDLVGNDNLISTGANKLVTYQPPAKLEWMSPANNYNFGTQGIDTSPVSFTLKNTGGFSTSTFSVSQTGSFPPFEIVSNNCLSTTLGPGGECVVQVRFLGASSAMAYTSYTGGLTVTTASGGTASISFTGTIPPGDVSWDMGGIYPSNPHYYGSHYAASSIYTYRLINTWSGYTGVISITLTGNSSRWEKISDSCHGIRLAPVNGSCTVQLRFKGDYANGVGSFYGSLTAQSSLSGIDDYVLYGTVIQPPAAIIFTSTPANPDNFGTTNVNVTKQYTLYNNSAGTSTAISVSKTGTNPSAWTLGTEATACHGKTLTAGASCTITLTFTASSLTNGSYSSTISYSASTGGSGSVNVSGTVGTP